MGDKGKLKEERKEKRGKPRVGASGTHTSAERGLQSREELQLNSKANHGQQNLEIPGIEVGNRNNLLAFFLILVFI